MSKTYTPEQEQKLYCLALKKWGSEAQLDMVIEECAELIKAIQKYRRGLGDWREVAEELGDVQNCINQFKHTYPYFEEIRQSKLERLEALLGDGVINE